MLGIPNVGVHVAIHEPMFIIVLQHWEYYIYIYVYIYMNIFLQYIIVRPGVINILIHVIIYSLLVVSTPLKYISQLGLLFPMYGKIKNVPNHQPVLQFSYNRHNHDDHQSPL